MVQAAISFFVLAIVAFILGANNIAGLSMEIGQMILVVFLILAAISFVISLLTGKNPRKHF